MDWLVYLAFPSCHRYRMGGPVDVNLEAGKCVVLPPDITIARSGRHVSNRDIEQRISSRGRLKLRIGEYLIRSEIARRTVLNALERLRPSKWRNARRQIQNRDLCAKRVGHGYVTLIEL